MAHDRQALTGSYYTDDLKAITRAKRSTVRYHHDTVYHGSIWRASIVRAERYAMIMFDQRHRPHMYANAVSHPGIVKLSDDERAMMLFQRRCCYLCARTYNSKYLCTREHVMPKIRGGTNDRNILLACMLCNVEKSGRVPTPRETACLNAFTARDQAAYDDAMMWLDEGW